MGGEAAETRWRHLFVSLSVGLRPPPLPSIHLRQRALFALESLVFWGLLFSDNISAASHSELAGYDGLVEGRHGGFGRRRGAELPPPPSK